MASRNIGSLTIINSNVDQNGNFIAAVRDSSGKVINTQMTPAYFNITNAQIGAFQSYIDKGATPMDCFINALQLIGYIDVYTANLLRLTSLAKQGFMPDVIEKIFIYGSGMKEQKNNLFQFMPLSPQYFNMPNSLSVLEKYMSIMPPGSSIFVGWLLPGGGHVFLISRTQDGRFFLLDPQLAKAPCDLTTKQCIDAFGPSDNRLFYILFRSNESFLDKKMYEDMGFDFSEGR
jgi:hypothetical protein